MGNNFTDIHGSLLSGLEEFQYPTGLTFDEARGHLFVTDTGKQRVRRYDIDLAIKNITKAGITAAGIAGVSGPNLTMFDNPTAIAFHSATNSLWVTDSRNNRVVRWTENASAGILMFDGLKGKPYGIYHTEKATYVSDSDDCRVWKLLPGNVNMTVAGGNGCGSLDSQLRGPTGLFVATDGTIYIVDTKNDRVMQWLPTPRPLGNVICNFNARCSFTLRDGEPTEGNLLAIVNMTDENEDVACGHTCADPRLDGANWSSIARPEGDWISDMFYDFGTPTLGDYGQYSLCWGAAPNAEDVLAGDCTGVPNVMGVLTVLPNVYPDVNATTNTSQCVKGARCYVDIMGYAFPEGTVENPNLNKQKGTEALTPPDSGPGSNVECGADSSPNFVGYRDFVSVNPAQTVKFRRPYAHTGNLTSVATVDFQIALVIGRQQLCVCYNGNMCYEPSRFFSYAGTMLTRGTFGSESWVCRMGKNCTIQIRGMFLKETDVAGVVSWDSPCLALAMENITNVSSVAVPEDAPNSDYSVATIHWGPIQQDGRYKVCYCASFDGRDVGWDTCDTADEFTQDAGALTVIRVEPTVYECPVSRPCVLTTRGRDLIDIHRLQVADGDPSICGFAGVVEYSFIYGVEIRANTYAPLSGGSTEEQTFMVDTFTAASPKSACYCPDYDQQIPFMRRLADGVCNDDIEYYQPVGPIIVRGPAATQPRCVMDQVCNVTVPGIDLSAEDRLQICPYDQDCGAPDLCPSVGPRAISGLQAPVNASPSATIFALGSVPLGLYRLCYCAPGNASSPSAIPCRIPADLTMAPVVLRVRGVPAEQRLSCVVEKECTVTVEGLDLSDSDELQLAPLNSTCGNASFVEPGLFLPYPNVSAVPEKRSTTFRNFYFSRTTLIGRYRVCYCVEATCASPSDYYLDAGVMFVKGITERYHAARCRLGEPCSFEISGTGLTYANDTVQLVPTYLGCGGANVIVSGDNQVGLLNGIYDRGPELFESRPWYQSRKSGQFLFYDLYSYRWVMGPERNPDVPETVGWAWVDDLFWQEPSPDRVITPWQVWDKQDAWVDQPLLKVGRVTAEAGEIDENPCNATTDLVPDPHIGFPYLISERFQVGRVNRLASYLICFCPAVDGPDRDGQVCSGDDEFLVPNGMLLIEVVRGNERHHCEQHTPCLVRTVLPEFVGSGPLLVTLLPSDGRCNQGPYNNSGVWPAAINISGRIVATEGTFDLGSAPVSGSYQVCLCTAYDDGVDQIPCSEMHEFYQQIGTLTVMPAVRLSYEFGKEATLNLTRGLGLAGNDTVGFIRGDSCGAGGDVGLAMRPQEVGATGAWSAFVLGRAGTILRPGYYVACLCPAWDGGDADDLPCNDDAEFYAKVAIVTVNVVTSPVLVSSVISAVELQVRLEASHGGRRVSSAAGNASNASNASDAPTPMDAALGFAAASAIAEALRGAVAAVLGPSASSVSVDAEGVDLVATDTTVPLRVGVQAGFTAQVIGSTAAQIGPNSSENVSCPGSLMYPPWNSTGNPEEPGEDQLRGCLGLSQLMDFREAAFLAELDVQLSRVSVPGVTGFSVLGLPHGFLAPSLEWEYPPSSCVKGVACQTTVTSDGHRLDSGALLVLRGEEALCGSRPPPATVVDASQRAAAGFSSNPTLAPAGAMPTEVQRISLREPSRSGFFSLCYCSGAACALDRDFYQRAGTLTVRGTSEGLEFPCISFKRCAVMMQGTELTAWDRTMVVPWEVGCGNESVALDRIEHNPASAERVVGVDNGTVFRDFEFGMVTRIGRLRICYCASLTQSSSEPCTQSVDYSMTGGTLWVRGVDSTSFMFSCVKDDINTELCPLMLTGKGLKPGMDALLLVPEGARCGSAAGELADVFTPNPIVTEAGGPMVPWYDTNATSSARWHVRAKRIGTYRVCFCPMDRGGTCLGESDFFHPAGELTVRGAVGKEAFICRADDRCFITITGFGLSMRDHVKVINGDQFCDWVGAGSSLVELNPAPAVEVSDDRTRAEFALGVVQPLSDWLTRPLPLTLRVCYCASNNLDREGLPCSNGTDFTHSAGIINTVVCPKPPSVVNFNPPVQDIFGELGDPWVRLFSIPKYTCEDQDSRTQEDLLLFSRLLSYRGRTSFNESRVLATKDGQCTPNVPAGAPQMNMMQKREIEISVLGSMRNSGSTPRGGDIRIRIAHHLRGVTSVLDVLGNFHICPIWEVNIVPLACDLPAATLFGLLLHATILLATLIFLFSKRIGAFVRFVKALRRAAFSLGGGPSDPGSPKPSAQKPGGAAPGFSKGLPASKTGTLTPAKSRPLSQEESSWDTSGLAPVLASGWWAFGLAVLRVLVLVAHLLLFMAFGQMPDVVMLVVVPLLIVMGILFLQFVLLAKAAGLGGACAAILCPSPYVPPSALGQIPEPGQGRFAVPPLLHSAAAVAKLHLDLALPAIARRHHCELWRVAFLLLVWVIVVQVVIPLWSLFFNVLSPRRAVPSQVVPLALTVFGTLAGDEEMLGPEPLGLEPVVRPEDDSDLDSVVSKASRNSLFSFASAGPRGLRRLGERMGFRSKEAGNRSKEAARSKSPRSGPSQQPTPKGSKEPAADVLGALGFPGRPRPIMNVRGEEDVSNRKEKDRKKSLRKAAMEAMAERAARGQRAVPRRLVASVPEAVELEPQDEPQEEEEDERYGCCWPLEMLLDAVAVLFGGVWWVFLVVVSPTAPALPEELQRHRAVGLYAFMEASGWHVATSASRETVEEISGVSVTHMQGRWTMLYSLFGGLDLTAIHAFVAIAYAPRLSEVETFVLVIAALVGLFQASRPGTGRAVLWLMELLINGPRSFIAALVGFALLRFVGSAPLSQGCPRFTYAFTAWSCSVLLLELPLFLLWRRLRAFDYGELRRRAQNAIIGFVSDLPGRLQRLFRPAPPPKEAEDDKGAVVVQPALADAKPSQIAPLAQASHWPEAEPVVTAVKKLVDILPEGMKMVLVDEPDGDIRILQELVEGLISLPPPKYNLEVRVQRLASMDELLHSLAMKLEDEDKHCRKAFNEVLRLVDAKLYRLRLAVDAVRLVRSCHYRLGSLENRAELAAEVLPDAPQMWVVHWATLLSLGRLPSPLETECLVPAEEVCREFPGDVVLVPVVHRPRSEGKPDPHGVTCRQLVMFAKWYRQKWGLNYELFFWIDCCCFPEIAEAEAEAERNNGSDHGTRASSKKSADSGFWSLPTSRASSKATKSDFSMGTRYSSRSRLSRFSSTSSRCSRLSGTHSMSYRTQARSRGLKSLQAWMGDDSDNKSVSSSYSGLSSINFGDRASIIGGISEGASTLMLRGRASSKLRSTNFKTLSDLQRIKRDKDLGRDPSKISVGSRNGDNPLARLGLETPDVNSDMLQDGSDLVRLLVFAAADAVVLCETHDSEDCAWVRLGLALAHAFAPTGQFVYAVDRSLVHIPTSRKPKTKAQDVPEHVPGVPIAKLAAPVSAQSFPGAVEYGGHASDSAAADAALRAVVNSAIASTPSPGMGGIMKTIVTAAPGPVDSCIWREMIPEFQERVGVRRQCHFLADPTDWAGVHLERPQEDRARIVRLTSLCLDRPTTFSVGGYRRSPLEFGSSTVRICRLETKNRVQHQWRRSLRKQKTAASAEKALLKKPPSTPPESSSSSGDDEDDEWAALQDDDGTYVEKDTATKFKSKRPILELTERNWDLYYQNKMPAAPGKPSTGTSKSKHTDAPGDAVQVGRAAKSTAARPVETSASELLRRAADMRARWGSDSTPNQILHPLPSLKRLEENVPSFHLSFHSGNVLIGSAGATAEQFRPKDCLTGRHQVGNPGLAILSKPLKVRGAVCPDKYKARGVSFDIKVEAVNAGWKDGLGIGFTAQDPDAWPSDKLKPRHASQMPRICVCGYSGRWVMEGRSELVHSLNPGQGAWEPGSVRVGDVVTAVLAAPPADVMRVLVNGRLVAERPALSSGLPDPSEAPLWGIVELDGACAKVRLGASDAPSFAADLTELVTRARK